MDNTRNFLQNWYDGEEKKEDLFVFEKNELWQIGFEVGGIIYYGYPSGDNLLLNLVDDNLGQFAEVLYGYSKVRLEYMSKYCPTITRMIKDGAGKRFDSVAIVQVANRWEMIRLVPHLNLLNKIENDKMAVIYDPIINHNVISMIDMRTQAFKEIKAWNGFSTLDEMAIAAKEMLPGGKIGYTIGKLIAGL